MPEKKEEVKVEKIVVVTELPTQQYNQVKDETGETINLISITQALTEMYNDIKEIKKAVG